MKYSLSTLNVIRVLMTRDTIDLYSVLSNQLELVFKINFLVDTGASTTILSWNEVTV